MIKLFGLVIRSKNKPWKEVLCKYKCESVEKQLVHKPEILTAIKEMIDTNPTEKDFSFYLSGIVMFPETIYYLFKKKVK